MATADLITQLKKDFDDVYAAGKAAGSNSYYDSFWDTFQDYGNRRSYRNAFQDYGFGWKDNTTYNPKYPIILSSNGFGANNTFANSTGITDTKVDIICEGSVDLVSTFSAARTLKTIKKLVVNEGVKYSGTFSSCTALENIIFDGIIANSLNFANSSLLTVESINNIIGCLKDLTGGTAQTLTVHKSVGEKLTDEQKATITAKNWELVY